MYERLNLRQDPLDILVEQFAFLIAGFRRRDLTASDRDRLMRIEKILIEPFATKRYEQQIWRRRRKAA